MGRRYSNTGEPCSCRWEYDRNSACGMALWLPWLSECLTKCILVDFSTNLGWPMLPSIGMLSCMMSPTIGVSLTLATKPTENHAQWNPGFGCMILHRIRILPHRCPTIWFAASSHLPDRRVAVLQVCLGSNENCGREDTTRGVFPPAGSLKAIHITQKSFSFYFSNPAHPNKFTTVPRLIQLR